MSPFLEPPTARTWRPVQTIEMDRLIRRRLKRAGLLSEDPTSSAWQDCEDDALYLLNRLNAEQTIEFSSTQWRNIGNIIGWIYEYAAPTDGEQIRNAVLNSKLKLNEDAWCVLLSIHFADQELVSRMKNLAVNWGTSRTRRLVRFFGDVNNANFADLPNAFASHIVSSEATLMSVQQHIAMVPKLPLYEAVWDRLLSIQAADWVISQPIDEVRKYLDIHKRSDVACLIARQILEPLHKNGLTSSDVRPGAPLSDIVQMLVNRVSTDNADKRKLIGEPALKVIQWWLVQRDLAKFFLEFAVTAMPDRETFWRQYVNQIEDIKPFRSACALAMFINGYWYVEFGIYGNACWRYRADDFRKLLTRIPSQPVEKDLKSYPKDHKSHFEGWQNPFIRWIGVRPQHN